MSIDTGLLTNIFPWMIKPRRLEKVENFLEIVSKGGHAGRIRRLDRILPGMLHNERFLEKMGKIEELLICDNSPVDTHEYPLGIHLPKTLKQLTLCQTSYDLRQLMPLPQLTQLSMWQLNGSARISVPFVIDLLRNLPQLETCTLDINIPQHGSSRRHDHEPILLSHLDMLVLSWDDSVDVGSIMDLLVAPNVLKLGLVGSPPNGVECWDHLKKFLTRCRPPLENLCIGELCQLDILLSECLEISQGITHLSLAHCPLQTGFFETLTRKEDDTKSMDFLPNLLHISLEWCTIDGSHDLLRMLKSRSNEADHGSTRQRIEEVILRLKGVGPEIECDVRAIGVETVQVKPWLSLYMLH